MLTIVFMILCTMPSRSIQVDVPLPCPLDLPKSCLCWFPHVLIDCTNGNLSAVPSLHRLSFTTVNLSHNKISILKSDMFSTELVTLNISSNTLTRIPGDVFSSSPNLSTLDLSFNYLTRLPGELFNSTPQLQTLDLSFNNLTRLPGELFNSTPQLQTLYLASNNLTRIPGDLFNSTPNLTTFILCLYNNLTRLPGELFNSTPQLQTLYLASNNLTRIPGDLFNFTSNLTTLDISSNKFRKLDDIANQSPGSLSINKLLMSRNFISELPTEFFFTMKQLNILDLSRNSISNISIVNMSKIHMGEPEMEVLLLHRNKITVVPERAFFALTKLRYICLFNNHIHMLGPNLFSGTNLNIYLFGNNLTSIDGNPFGSHVNKIHLFGNKLEQLNLNDVAWDNLEKSSAKIIVNCRFLDILPAHKKPLEIDCALPSDHPHRNGSIPMKLVNDVTFPLADTLKMEGFICNENECTPCSVGSFGNTMNECMPCPSGGFYQDDIGKSGDNPGDMACKKCPNGTYVRHEGKGISRDKCAVCPDGTNQTMHAGFRACHCKINHTRVDRYKGCSLCVDPGVNCSQDFQALYPGYYWNWDYPKANLSQYEKFVQNLKSEGMKLVNNHTKYHGEIPRVFKCPRRDSCINNGNTINVTCARGYRGWLCAKCEKEFYSALNTCLPCPEIAALLAVFLGFILVCILLCMLLSWQIERGVKHRKQRRSIMDVIISRIKILLGFYQIVGKLFESLHDVAWVGPFELVGTFISYMELNVVREVVSPRCLFKTTVLGPKNKFVIGMTIPILTMVIPFLYYKIRKAYMKYRYQEFEIHPKLKKIKSRLLTYITVVLFFIYPNISTIVFNMYPTSCEEFHLSKNATAENATIWRLRSDYDIDCQGSKMFVYYISAYFFTVVYVIAFPAILLYLLWKYFTPWSTMQYGDESDTSKMDPKICSTKEEIPLVVSHNDVPPEVPVWLKFLCENYRDQFWFWEIIELTRKSTQTLLITMYGWENTKTVFLTICISVLFLTLHARYMPMKCPYDQRLQLLSLIAIFINVVIAAMKESSDFSKTRNPIFFVILNTAVLLIITGEVLFRMMRHIKKIIPKKAKVAVIGMWLYLIPNKKSKRERIV